MTSFSSLSSISLKERQRAATTLVQAMQTLHAQASHAVAATLNGAEFVEWEHYPPNDVRDQRHHTQYYYHAHTSEERTFLEHGHFHCFVHAQEMGLRRPQQRYEEAPAHLVAISMNNLGFPTGLFLVNRWVTKGPWLSYQDYQTALPQFKIHGPRRQAPVDQFLTALMHFYRDDILQLVKKRDQNMQKSCRRRDRRSVFADRSIEVLSYQAIDLLADIDALENAGA